MPKREDVQAELEAAQISTLHSLCGRICQEHPEEAGVPADFAVLDELRGGLWRENRLTDALDELSDEHFGTLPYPLMQAALEALLADPIAAKHALERALDGGAEEWETLVAEARKGAMENLLRDPEFEKSRKVLNYYQGSPNDRMEVQRQAALAALSELDEALASDADPRPSLEAVSSLKLNMGSVRNWGEGELEAIKEALKAIRELVRCELERKIITLRLGPADERLAEVLPVLNDAFKVAKEFVSAAKRRARVLDYADLEVHALRALEHEEVRAYYRERWPTFLVDEFQDTNPVQSELLDRLTTGAKLTVVGDEKQSIYGFRRADVTVFRHFRERILSEGGSEVLLATSFRTHAELVRKFNTTFSPVLGNLHQDLIEKARDNGVRSFYALVKGKNKSMLSVLRHLDLPERERVEEGEKLVEVRLAS
jgi:ATP-dependent helicase/nuclease subunit A